MTKIQRLAAMACMACGIVVTHAETRTFTLTGTEVRSFFSAQQKLTSDDRWTIESKQATFSFEQDGFKITMLAVTSYDFVNFKIYESTSLFDINTGSNAYLSKFTMTVEGGNALISKVSANIACCYSNKNINSITDITVGENTASSEVRYQSVLYAESPVETVLEISNPVSAPVVIDSYLYNSSACDVIFTNLEIQYIVEDEEESGEQPSAAASAPAMSLSVPAGHPVELISDDDDHTIYYSIDSSDDWFEYDGGIIFDAPGTYTISFYAESAGCSPSEIVTETVVVTKPSGLAYAIALNNEITVSGVIVAQSDSYTLISENVTTSSEALLAIEHKYYPSLALADVGTEIEATGRITDRFSVAALGSISALSIAGVPVSATSITQLRVIREDARSYDLLGRPATVASTPRLVIRADGTKHIMK